MEAHDAGLQRRLLRVSLEAREVAQASGRAQGASVSARRCGALRARAHAGRSAPSGVEPAGPVPPEIRGYAPGRASLLVTFCRQRRMHNTARWRASPPTITPSRRGCGAELRRQAERAHESVTARPRGSVSTVPRALPANTAAIRPAKWTRSGIFDGRRCGDDESESSISPLTLPVCAMTGVCECGG